MDEKQPHLFLDYETETWYQEELYRFRYLAGIRALGEERGRGTPSRYYDQFRPVFSANLAAR